MDERVFDVSKPNRSAPGATSKPIIVGHHPIMNDPMVTGRDSEHEPAPAPPQPEPFSPPPSDNPPPSESLPASIPEATPIMSHTFPSISNQDAGSIPPVDAGIGGISDSLNAEAPEPTTPASVPGGDQQFIRPDRTETPQHNLPPPDHPSVTPAPISHHSRGGRKTKMLAVLILAIIVGAYLLIDAGVAGKGINLPFHIFGQDDKAQTQPVVTPAPASSQSSSSSQVSLPEGFVNYKLAGTDLNIPYPSAWGAPTATTEMGYSKRGGTNKADVTYAYLINFATNKDVQIALTSGQYLPPTRTALYYDMLQWCTGSVDTKFYKQLLHYITVASVDTPTTTTCDQGPLNDAAKINSTTIVQVGTKAADGTVAGDIYTRNLKITELPVMRVKDTTGKNADNIKKILDNLTLASTSQAQQ